MFSKRNRLSWHQSVGFRSSFIFNKILLGWKNRGTFNKHYQIHLKRMAYTKIVLISVWFGRFSTYLCNLMIPVIHTHRYIKQLFLVLGTRLAQFERYCSVVKCVLDGPLDTHIWPFSRTLGEEILHLYSIYCFWVPFSGRISHHFPTKPSFSPIFRIARLFENFLYQSISILTWPGAFGGPILLTRTKPDMI